MFTVDTLVAYFAFSLTPQNTAHLYIYPRYANETVLEKYIVKERKWHTVDTLRTNLEEYFFKKDDSEVYRVRDIFTQNCEYFMQFEKRKLSEQSSF